MKRFVVLLVLLALLTGVAIAQEPVSGGTLRAAWQSEWESLDPHLASSEATFQVLNNVMETLTFFDDDMNLIPWLAESWEQSEDGLVWTFQLREGVQFSNGRELTAADVAWSFGRLTDPAIGSGNAWRVGGAVVEAVDDYTVTFTTPSPIATLPASLAANKSTGIMAQESVNEEGIVAAPIGSGPFVISAVEGTTRILLERNDNYWQEGLPYLDAVEVIPIADDAARELALKGGEVDWIFTISPQNLQNLQDDPDVVVELSPRLSYDYFALNLNKAPFDNVLVRQAIATAIDRQVICDFAFFGLCEPVQGPTASGSPWFVDYTPYTGGPDAARALLAEAGYADGFDMVINPVIGFGETIRGAQVVQQQLAEIGINVQVVPEEVGIIIEKQGTGEFDALMWSWLGLTDAEDYYYLQHRTGQGFNFTGFSDADFDALVDAGRGVADVSERYAIYEQANQILVDAAPYVYMYAKSEVKAWNPVVQGYTVRSDSANNFWTVWLASE
jgi:peptide/nickel transport system substrate-binding protein